MTDHSIMASQQLQKRQTVANAAASSMPPPILDLLLPNNTTNNPLQPPPLADTNPYRAVHKVRLAALAHNYGEVESAANRQRCSVIVVVKADGYGHGAIPTAVFLADSVGADAFAVATLEEAITLRRALQQTAKVPPGDLVLLNRLGNHPPDAAAATAAAAAVSASGANGSSNVVPAAVVTGTTTNGIHHPNSSNNRVDHDNILAGTSIGGTDAVSILYGPPGLRRRSMRQAHIRILVLGPPVGFPRCFDDYYHHNIEVSISGAEVAKALLEWVVNKNERMRKQVERAAAEAKELILSERDHIPSKNGVRRQRMMEGQSSMDSNGESVDNESLPSSSRSSQSSSLEPVGGGGDGKNQQPTPNPAQQLASAVQPQYHPPSATLSNVTGSDLAKEVREILKNQKLAEVQQHHHKQQHHHQQQNHPFGRNGQVLVSKEASFGRSTTTSNGASSTISSSQDFTRTTTSTTSTTMTTTATLPSSTMDPTATSASKAGVQVFAGIEDAARVSRTRQKAIASSVFHEDEDDDDENDDGDDDVLMKPTQMPPKSSTISQLTQVYQPAPAEKINPAAKRVANKAAVNSKIPTNTNRNALPRKRLRWHALVDSGMGRLGFRTEPVAKEEQGKRRDSVEIIKELVDLEVEMDCPVEFFGMCTHMADASNTVKYDYTHSQMDKFQKLLNRVRAAGISVPTVSTDNSAALLTPHLNHFDADKLLSQPGANTRGFVRTGGAIFGQRPTFPQLRAVSTLMASVRHVAIMRKGDSVGYDRAYVAKRNVRIATLTLGFADGYDRALGNGNGEVSIRGHLFPVAGNVCMDMLMVELGPAEDKHGAGAQVVVGDTAILWGPDDGEEGDGHMALKDVAGSLTTTQSALTCGLNKERVLRQYAY